MDEQMRSRVVAEMDRLGWFHDDDPADLREQLAEGMTGQWVALRLAALDVWTSIKANLPRPWWFGA